VEGKKDLGVQINCTGKSHLQCSKASKKRNQVFGQQSKISSAKIKSHLFDCTKHFRLHLEYAIQVWSPWNESDQEKLEKFLR
jgi:hypothetical protein